MLSRYQREAKEFSEIPDSDAEGKDIDDKGKEMGSAEKKTKDDNYDEAVDNQVESGSADEGGANVTAKSIGADESLYDGEESLLGNDDDLFDDEDDDEDSPTGRPEVSEEPDDEVESYGTDDE